MWGSKVILLLSRGTEVVLPKTAIFQKILQTIWHQVATAGEVFVVGRLQEDDTVKGGTGWAVELARHFKKPLFVFDQEKFILDDDFADLREFIKRNRRSALGEHRVDFVLDNV